jgi:hypothetical protein
MIASRDKLRGCVLQLVKEITEKETVVAKAL